jgi:hypothetical protein
MRYLFGQNIDFSLKLYFTSKTDQAITIGFITSTGPISKEA